MADSTPHAFSLPPDPTVGINAAPPSIAPGNFNLSYQSYVAMNDGTVGAALTYVGGGSGSRTGRIVWATAPTPAALFAPASVVIGPTLMEQSVQQHVGFEATVNRGPDGALYLVVWVMRATTLIPALLPFPPNEGTYVYRSVDEGASWTLHGNVQVYGGGFGGGAFGGFGDTGEIYYSDSGRWIVPYGIIYSFFGATRGRTGIAISDDFGATWTTTLNTSANYTSGSSRQIAYNTVDGYLYFALHRSQNPNYQWLVSTDDGSSWSVFESINYFSGQPMENENPTGIASPTGFTWFTGNRNVRGRAYDITTALSVAVDPNSEPVLVRNWEGFNASNRGVGMQPVGGGWWAFMDTTEILGIPAAAPTIPGASLEVTCCDDEPEEP